MEVVSSFILVWWMSYYLLLLLAWSPDADHGSKHRHEKEEATSGRQQKSRMYLCCCLPIELRPSSPARQRALCAGRWESVGSSRFEGWVMAGRGQRAEGKIMAWVQAGGWWAIARWRSSLPSTEALSGPSEGKRSGTPSSPSARDGRWALKRSTLFVDNRGLSAN